MAALAGAGPAAACGGLIGPRGGVNLVKTTTLAGYHGGIEHYVTAFKFLGAGGQFGSIVPLPGVPTKVERGGDWTLQRLVREVQPPQAEFAAAGARHVPPARQGAGHPHCQGRRARSHRALRRRHRCRRLGREHGFVLPPDAPEVLDFYASRSPIFMAAVFDGNAAKAAGQQIGDGTPIHLTIPTSQPWVPLRILGLGREANERIQADVFLLTDRQPSLLPVDSNPGLTLDRSEPASSSLLSDLHDDRAWTGCRGRRCGCRTSRSTAPRAR